MNIASLAIKRPVFIVMIVISIITLGLIGYKTLPIDLLPNVEFPTIQVIVVYPGASAEEIETLITRPIEDAFSTLEGIDKVSSSSKEGVASIAASFNIGVDPKFAEIKVRDKVQMVKTMLPKEIQEPTIYRFSFSDIPIMYTSVSGKRDISFLRDIAEDIIKPELEKIPGIANVQIFGGRTKVVRINIDKALLLAKGVSMNQIQSAIQGRNLNFPAGTLYGGEKNITVRVIGEFDNVDDIGDMTITSNTGKIVRLKDLGKVEFTFEREESITRVKGVPAVTFAVFKQSGTNSVKASDLLRKKLKEMEKKLPKDVQIGIAVDTTVGIRRNVSGVTENIVIGAVLAVLIVWLFLGNFRSAIITAVALPNSIIGAFYLISLSNFTINVMTLLALALAVGLLIDDSIVVRENIFRYIEKGMNPKEAAEKGTNEVALAVNSTTLSVMAVFIPISMLTGVIGQFFKEFGFTIAFALAISLLDAFTTAPMLSAYWYKKKTAEVKENLFTPISSFVNSLSVSWNRFYDDMQDIYRDILVWALGRKKQVIFITICLFVASFMLVPFIEKGFMTQNQGNVSITLESYPGAPIEVVDSKLKEIEDYFRSDKFVETYFAVAGNGQSNSGFVYLTLVPLEKRKLKDAEYLERVRKFVKEKEVDKYFSVKLGVGPPNSSGGNDDMNTPVLVNVKGDDLAVLSELSGRIKKIIQETPGTADADSTLKSGKPEIVLRADPLKAEELGVSTAMIGGILRTLIQGSKISTYRKGEKEYDIKMELSDSGKKSVDDIKNIVITTPRGIKVPLSSLCSFTYSAGPVDIRRENKQRVVKVFSGITPGYSSVPVVGKVRERIKKEIKLPDGYAVDYGGQSEQFGELMVQMMGAMLLSVLFMYMILASLYNSFIQPLILMISVPLAIIGAFIGLLVTGYPLDLFGFIGLLMVLGLVAKNGILLIDFTNKMRREGMNITDALLHAAPIRLRPILMTSLAMIFGMLPIALSWGEGSKGRESLAVVVIGGLITSTLLTLVVIPVVYELVEKRLEKRRLSRQPR